MHRIYKSQKFAAAFATQGKAAARRQFDHGIARQLVAGGISEREIYSDIELVGFDLSEESHTFYSFGKLLKKWNGFDGIAQAKQAKLAHDYRQFCNTNGSKTAIQLVLRRVKDVDPSLSLRQRHAADSAALGKVIQYARRKFPNISFDLIAAELGPKNARMGVLEWHFHLLLRVQPKAKSKTPPTLAYQKEIIDLLRAYLSRAGWMAPKEEPESPVSRPSGDQAYYLAKGLPSLLRSLQSLDADQRDALLALIYRQTRGLALIRALGQFRKWRASRKADQRKPVNASTRTRTPSGSSSTLHDKKEPAREICTPGISVFSA